MNEDPNRPYIKNTESPSPSIKVSPFNLDRARLLPSCHVTTHGTGDEDGLLRFINTAERADTSGKTQVRRSVLTR